MAQGHHGTGYGIYLRTWAWLFIITVVEVGITFLSLPRTALVGLLVVLAVMKVVLIAAYFMHLRFERLGLVYMVVTPLVLIVALILGLTPDSALMG